MDYKKLMGYDDKKKVIKEQSKPKVNKVLESLKEEFGHKQQLKEVGAAPSYKEQYLKVTHAENQQAKEVNNFVKLLTKKGMKKEAYLLASKYLKGVKEFDSFLKKLIRKMM